MKAILVLLLLCTASVAAQPGPAPGHDALSYAQAYASQQAANASEDPVSYVKERADADAVAAEAAHTLYMACWAADDQGIEHAACDPYYAPRGEAEPEQPAEPAPVAANGTINATQVFVDEVVDAANDTVADPGSAPSQAKRVVAAAKDFLHRIGQGVADAAHAAVDVVVRAVEGLGQAAGAIADAGLATATALADGAIATTQALAAGAGFVTDTTLEAASASGQGAGAAADRVGHAAKDATEATGAALHAAGQGVGQAGQAIGHATADAARSAGQGMATAGQAVGQAIGDAASAVKDVVSGLFGQDEPARPTTPEPPEVPATGTEADSVLDSITGLLE